MRGTAARLGAGMPFDIAAMLEDARQLSWRIAPFRPVLCHNDLLPANLIDDGCRLWLVDWEYGGVGHPLFDLANVSANAALAEDQEIALLSAYRETVKPDPRISPSCGSFRPCRCCARLSGRSSSRRTPTSTSIMDSMPARTLRRIERPDDGWIPSHRHLLEEPRSAAISLLGLPDQGMRPANAVFTFFA